MLVRWRDFKNPKGTIDCYKIQYDDDMVVPAPVESPNTFSMKLGHPKIQLGKLYTVKVCSKNSAGQGNWSKATIFRFKNGHPNKPRKPTAIALSHTEIVTTASRLYLKKMKMAVLYSLQG